MAKILIVDDSVFARTRLRMLCEGGGHQVIGDAGTGKEALELYKSLGPELVTLDYIMGDKSGAAVLEEIIEHDPDARVIMISGSGDATIKHKVLQAGAKEFVGKFDSEIDILKVIDAVMEN
jgi:two-component system chemotaxis response regulator CheY